MENTDILDRLIQILCDERGEAVPTLSDGQKPGFFSVRCAMCARRCPYRTNFCACRTNISTHGKKNAA